MKYHRKMFKKCIKKPNLYIHTLVSPNRKSLNPIIHAIYRLLSGYITVKKWAIESETKQKFHYLEYIKKFSCRTIVTGFQTAPLKCKNQMWVRYLYALKTKVFLDSQKWSSLSPHFFLFLLTRGPTNPVSDVLRKILRLTANLNIMFKPCADLTINVTFLGFCPTFLDT